MLKITHEPAATARLKLEGQLVGPWVAELRRACDQITRHRPHLELQLGDLDFADRDGIALLRVLVNRGVQLESCSAFIQEQLRTAAPEGNATAGQDV